MNINRLLNFLALILGKLGFSGRQPRTAPSWRSLYRVGKWTYGDPQVLSWEDGTSLTVGAYCSIAAGVQIFLGGNHRTDLITTFPFAEMWARPDLMRGSVSNGDVIIGNDVWLASRCAIMSGVTIGDGAIVGAYAVVAKDVPPYAVVVGNPARVIRMRFPQHHIETLLKIQWWNWSDDVVKEALPLLMSGNVEDLEAFASTRSNNS